MDAEVEEVNQWLAYGDHVLVAPSKKAKSEAWKSFDHVHNEVDESVGYVKCKKCGVLLKYESKTTGNSSLIRHAHRSCSTPAMVPNNHAYKGSQSSLYRLMLPLLFY